MKLTSHAASRRARALHPALLPVLLIAVNASDNTPPLRTIAGPNTGLADPR